jgi:U1 small nuclear ribonucleoprotein
LTEKKLKKEFENYGSVKQVRIVRNILKENKSRGYGFVEFEHKKDFLEAYKTADGKKIDGRRIFVDFEKGRTLPTFKPMRIGGGYGGERRGKSMSFSRSVSKEKEKKKKKKQHN